MAQASQWQAAWCTFFLLHRSTSHLGASVNMQPVSRDARASKLKPKFGAVQPSHSQTPQQAAPHRQFRSASSPVDGQLSEVWGKESPPSLRSSVLAFPARDFVERLERCTPLHFAPPKPVGADCRCEAAQIKTSGSNPAWRCTPQLEVCACWHLASCGAQVVPVTI